jgi:hypothetical protein
LKKLTIGQGYYEDQENLGISWGDYESEEPMSLSITSATLNKLINYNNNVPEVVRKSLYVKLLVLKAALASCCRTINPKLSVSLIYKFHLPYIHRLFTQ